MQFVALPLTAAIAEYESQAESLLEAWRAGDAGALQFFHAHLPRMLDDRVKWLPKRLSEEELRAAVFDMDDARTAVARGYDFAGWEALAAFAAAIERRDPEVYPFERAVDAVADGDLASLRSLLKEYPGLVRARSKRVTHFDPPVHRATLLHYVAANGTEGYRQRTPGNAVEIATALLDAGAEADALANLYGGECTTLSLLVSSCHPAQAGVQVPLIDLLAARGASLAETGTGNWVSPVETALVFGYRDAAEELVRHGAPLSLPAAAGLGRLKLVRELLPESSELARHRALAIAAQSGEVETTRLLLEAGEDPNRFDPPGTHSHTTPLHQAVWAGHLDVVRLLVARGARLDIRDTIYNSTPLGWAEYGGREEIAALLRGFERASDKYGSVEP
ncbi:MAG: ankyrin repeat domain-containing protein [Bryobacteraceae bacterium]|nr:ankyrin repeat domain-containing protein [Bryobacteraceae bacterium]